MSNPPRYEDLVRVVMRAGGVLFIISHRFVCIPGRGPYDQAWYNAICTKPNYPFLANPLNGTCFCYFAGRVAGFAHLLNDHGSSWHFAECSGGS